MMGQKEKQSVLRRVGRVGEVIEEVEGRFQSEVLKEK
jgi:hypothetical protein